MGDKNEGVDPRIIAQVCSRNPGDFFNQFLPTIEFLTSKEQGLGRGFGQFIAGHSASFTVLDLNTPTKLTKKFLKTKCSTSPFIGMIFPGSVKECFLRGKRM